MRFQLMSQIQAATAKIPNWSQIFVLGQNFFKTRNLEKKVSKVLKAGRNQIIFLYQLEQNTFQVKYSSP